MAPSRLREQASRSKHIANNQEEIFNLTEIDRKNSSSNIGKNVTLMDFSIYDVTDYI